MFTSPVGMFASDAAFSPLDIPDCQCWLRSDVGITITGSGVSLWEDQAGVVSSDGTQGTDANRPTYAASGGLNNNAKLTFNGTSQRLDWALDLAGPKTLVMVFQSAANPGVGVYRVLADIYNASGGKTSSWWYTGDPLKTIWGDDHTGNQAAISDGTDYGTSGLMLVHTWDGVSVTSASSYTARRNNTPTTPVAGGAIDSTGESASSIGYWHRDALYFFNGDLYEIIVYDRALTSGEQDSLYTYGNNRYGI